VVRVDDVPLSVCDLGPLLGLPRSDGEHRPAVVLERDGERRAFLVDEVEGDREVTIRGLSWNLRHLPGVSGCTVIGDRVAPILDARELFVLGRDTRGVTDLADEKRQRRRQVLVADDSVTSRTLEKNILTAAGYGVTVACDGDEAWEMLRTTSIDLLISDVDMPGIDGVELVRRLRADERFRSLPVVLVTSLGNEEHKRRGAEAGADAYIVKGAFDQDELLQVLGRLL
jgi:two-component system chemotaxis sensor kinase CheA